MRNRRWPTVLNGAVILLLALVWAGCSSDDGNGEGQEDLLPELVSDIEEDGDQTDDTADVVDADSSDTEPDDNEDSDVLDEDADVGPIEPLIRDCGVELVYDGSAGSPASSVHVAGEFNGWSTEMTPMTQQDGQWTVELSPGPGSFAYKFVIDGQFEDAPPPDVYTQWSGGVENRRLQVPDCTVPEWQVQNIGISDDGLVTGEVQFARSTTEAPLDPASVVVTVADVQVDATVDSDRGVVEFSYQAQEYGKYTVRVSGADAEGVPAENNPLYTPLWYELEDFDWRDATLYLIFTDRFRDTDNVDHRIAGVEERANYLGGDFAGITEAIEEGYFQDMGVNAIWLSPIYDNPEVGYRDKRDDTKLMSGFHGYWPISLDPEPRYGDDQMGARDRLKELVDTAHENGIRILFDVALNHVHESHSYCDEGWCDLTCQCGSPGCGWDPSQRGLDCQFDYFLPDLSYRDPELLQQVVSDTQEMIEEYDIDGLRIDAARHMDHVIMRTLSMTIRDSIEARGGAEYYLVGETFTDDRNQIMQYVAEYELDGQFDFAMRSAIRGSLAGPGGSFRNLEAAAAASESPEGYGDFVWTMSPFFGNHDIKRMATVIRGDDQGPWGNSTDFMQAGPDNEVTEWDLINRMSMSYAFLLSYKGIPLLYYGDEIGLAGSDDPDNRRMMDWEWNANQRELVGRVQTLGQARRDIPSLRRGERREIWVDDDLYVFVRWMQPGEAAIVALHKGAAPRSETIQVPAEFGLEGLTLQSYNSDRTVTVNNGSIELQLNGWEYAIFSTE